MKSLVPRIHFYDQDFVDMYDRCWVWLGDAWRTSDKKIPGGWLCTSRDGIIDLFEASVSSLFLVYSNQNHSPESMIDYFYSMQQEDGCIPAKILVEEDTPIFEPSNPLGATLPLLSYVEFVFYHKIGNKKRLKETLPHLEKYYEWMKERFFSSNGLYKVPDAATCMGNLERKGALYTVDYNAALAIYALYMSNIGDILNDKELAFRYKRIYFALKTRINTMMWDEEDGIYYDLDSEGKRIKNKHIGAYWTLLAEIPNEEQGARMIEKLSDPHEFGTENPFPTVPVSSEFYDENGDGYRSGVVSFCTYMVVKGLMKYDSFAYARECCIRHLYFILDALNPAVGHGDSWEIYKPNDAGPAKCGEGIENRKRYLPMAGLVMITLMIENVIGLEVSLPRKTTFWEMQRLEEMGIEGLSLKRNKITILSNQNPRGWEIRLESEKLYYFTIYIIEGDKRKTLPIPSGKCSMFIDKL